MAAQDSLAEHGSAVAIPAIEPLLAHDYPLVRFYAKRAIEQLSGKPLDVDVQLPAD
jgi:hypothetical protein